MKPEEALKELSYDDTAYGGKCTCEVRQEAIEALKKQIPKKVLYEDVGYDFHREVNLYACICPSCGLHIIEFSDIDVEHVGMNNYCNRCGQRLDWSEENGR